MSESEKLADLLLQWEELREQGEDPSAETLCRDCPSLVDELRRRMRIVTQMESVLSVATIAGERRSSDSDSSASQREAIGDRPDIPGHELGDILGRGGMGVVYRARHLELERVVAVKVLDQASAGTPQFNRFLDEARAVARIRHPNIVQIYDYGQSKGVPFFSMELVEGGNLRQRVLKGPVDISEAARLIEIIARAIHVVHLEGYIHRDLKPANILLTPDDEPKVTDFGLVKRINDDSGHTKTGEILGTIGYMAPEQLDRTRGEIGPRTDIFALGAILYELLTGTAAVASNPAVALKQVLHDDPPSPRRIRSDVPRDIAAICLKCLARDPHDRYASAKELADDLQRYLTHQPVLARRAGTAHRTVKWIKRRPVIAAMMLILVVALATWQVVAGLRERRAVAQRKADAAERATLAGEILKRNCYDCHDGGPQEAGKKFDVLDHDKLIGSDRRIVVPGNPDDSRLIQRIADGSMPPEDLETTLPRISETELSILRAWIAEGAIAFPVEDPQNPTPPVVKYSHIADQAKEVFRKRCYECHKYDVAEGGIKILHHRLLLHVRKVVVPGSPDESELFQLIISEDEEAVMPPPSHRPLNDEEIDIIRRWIDAGAPPFPKSDE